MHVRTAIYWFTMRSAGRLCGRGVGGTDSRWALWTGCKADGASRGSGEQQLCSGHKPKVRPQDLRLKVSSSCAGLGVGESESQLILTKWKLSDVCVDVVRCAWVGKMGGGKVRFSKRLDACNCHLSFAATLYVCESAMYPHSSEPLAVVLI